MFGSEDGAELWESAGRRLVDGRRAMVSSCDRQMIGDSVVFVCRGAVICFESRLAEETRF